jgi:hypothetical protein
MAATGRSAWKDADAGIAPISTLALTNFAKRTWLPF